VIVVLAHAGDADARRLAASWPRGEAVLLTPLDLTRPGWIVAHPGAPGSFVAQGRRRATAAVRGAVVRLGTVDADELTPVVEADRAYAAAEVTALLAFWLRTLPRGPVNEPSPACLAGPAWSAVEWLTRAARAGLATGAIEVTVGASPVPPDGPAGRGSGGTRVRVTVVGERVLDSPAPEVLDGPLLALARTAGVGLMGADVAAAGGAWRLESVSLCPRLDRPAHREALADLLARRR